MGEMLGEVIHSKRELRELIDSSFFDFMFALERPPAVLFHQLHKILLVLIRSVSDIKDFADILKPVIKASKSIDKKDDLAKDLFYLTHPDKNQGEF